MAVLTDEHKLFIVQALACHDTPSQVVAAVKDEFKITVTRQQLAELLEIEEIVVGQGWINIAKPGKTPQLVRVWDNHAALLHRNRLANTQRGVTFGFTAQWQGRIAGQLPEPKVGLRGGVRVRVGESVKELVVASELGYFFKNAVAD